MSPDLTLVGSSIGFGGVAGFLAGYAIKKAIKIVMVVIGLFFAALAYLNYQGLVTINWNKLGLSATGLGNATGYLGGLSSQAASTMINFGIPFTGSFGAAFVVGFMKG